MTQLALPLVSAFLAFVVGLLFGLRVDWVTGGTALAAVPLLLSPWLHRRWIGQQIRADSVRLLLLAAMALAGAGHGAGALDRAEGDCRAHFADGTELTVRGALGANWNPPADRKARRPLLPLAAVSVEWEGKPIPGCGGGVRVRLPRESEAALAGAELVVRGRWTTLPRPVLGSGWPRDPGFTGYVSVDSMAVAAPPSYGAHPLLATRGRTERQLHRLMGRHGPLADALLLGRRETLDRELSDRFAKTGLVHLLAISGTHVALMGAVFVLIGRMLRLSRTRVAGLTIVLITLYLAVIGAPPSAVRSGIMLTLTLLAVVLQRPSASLPIVAAAALAILALQPMAVLDIGFQLSFAGVLGIILVSGAMMRRVPPAMVRNPAARWLTESLVVSVAAFVTTAPIVAHHFGQVAPVSILANLPAIPLTSLALIGIGAAAATEPVLPPLAHLLADGAGLARDLLNGVVDVAIQVPGGHAAVARPQWWAWAAAALVFLLALDAAGRMRDRVRWAVAGMSAAGAFLLLPMAGAAAGGGLEIDFIDVGQGDAIALRTPAGRWVLIDAGERADGWDAGERRVLPFLRARGARRIEALVLTHPHADHIGGAGAVMQGMPVGRVIDPGMPMGSPVYLRTLRVAEERGIDWNAARQDRRLQVDGVELLFMWPTVDALDAPDDPNDISAVVRVRYGAFSALFTGDASLLVEERLIARYGDSLRADVLKAGHHGSRTASSGPFLDTVDPELVVVSAGARNDYGHPHAEVLARLEVRGIDVARTDRDGTVRIAVEPGGTEWRRVEP
ncbi:DNA internalization-related competence protein ComEC/Rec2 [Longimicrobium sp.]|uniref:DNA internalization-related competence protein ComEC/Rec2 n=1 Tax=Longimicrobium sp. TaxID=2029185 RepID=UPI003B3B01DA